MSTPVSRVIGEYFLQRTEVGFHKSLVTPYSRIIPEPLFFIRALIKNINFFLVLEWKHKREEESTGVVVDKFGHEVREIFAYRVKKHRVYISCLEGNFDGPFKEFYVNIKVKRSFYDSSTK
jgi:hypothetical protein